MTIELWSLLVAFYAFWAGAVSEYKVNNGYSGMASVAAGIFWPLIAIGILLKITWRAS
ncbi:hypothetical protein [Pantoea sp.]|uniref:hypothetical protein n=1 Tax=Pantoea sp. TaxID=69393 RepID=UPI0028A9B8A4|nr:hypothetical protein [Pantoea sp.]